jgi:hypothetical protein
MVGEILGKKCVSVFVLVAVIVALEHDTPFIIVSGLGNPFVSRLTIYKFICWVLLESMLPRPLSCHSYVQEKSNLNKPSIESAICSYKFLPCRPSLCQFQITSYSDLPQICYLFHVIDGGYIKALL